MPPKLLNPGPVTLTERVRRALRRPDLCHREPEFAALQADVRQRLLRVYGNPPDQYAAVLLTGSGTAAVEAMVGSLVPRDGRALVVANGVYGERIAAMLAAHGKAFEVVRAAWTEPMDLPAVERRLAERPPFTHAIAVHHETTTGRLNDLAALGAICGRHGVHLLLDTVSSFGGETLDFERWNVAACAATANKCLHGVPGVSFVVARQALFDTQASGATCLYLDLFRYYQEQRRGGLPFTPAVQATYALQEALCELEEQGGWQARHEHYRNLARVVRAGLERRGASPLLADKADCSVILSAFALPPGVPFAALHAALKSDGFVIYPGQQSLEGTIFRVAVMGDLDRPDMDRFVECFARRSLECANHAELHVERHHAVQAPRE